jgi:hypothetical protein
VCVCLSGVSLQCACVHMMKKEIIVIVADFLLE